MEVLSEMEKELEDLLWRRLDSNFMP
jgi:hypothetical protein